jgi:hypothetical protein
MHFSKLELAIMEGQAVVGFILKVNRTSDRKVTHGSELTRVCRDAKEKSEEANGVKEKTQKHQGECKSLEHHGE